MAFSARSRPPPLSAPREHAHAGLEVVAHADLQLASRLVDQAFVAFGNVVAEVLEPVLPGTERAGHTPDNHAGAGVDLHGDTAVGDRASARHAQRPTNQDAAAP